MSELRLPQERRIDQEKLFDYCLPGKELTMFDEHMQVVLKCSLPNLGLEPGDVGVVVHTYKNGAAYEVEFLSLDGNTIGVATVEATDLRPASGRAVLHERELLAA